MPLPCVYSMDFTVGVVLKIQVHTNNCGPILELSLCCETGRYICSRYVTCCVTLLWMLMCVPIVKRTQYIGVYTRSKTEILNLKTKNEGSPCPSASPCPFVRWVPIPEGYPHVALANPTYSPPLSQSTQYLVPLELASSALRPAHSIVPCGH